MSVWQFMAAVDGYVKANTSEENASLSAKEADDLWGWLGSPSTEIIPAWRPTLTTSLSNVPTGIGIIMRASAKITGRPIVDPVA